MVSIKGGFLFHISKDEQLKQKEKCDFSENELLKKKDLLVICGCEGLILVIQKKKKHFKANISADIFLVCSSLSGVPPFVDLESNEQAIV